MRAAQMGIMHDLTSFQTAFLSSYVQPFGFHSEPTVIQSNMFVFHLILDKRSLIDAQLIKPQHKTKDSKPL